MTGPARGAALVIGVGPGLGAALCRALAGDGFAVAGISRSLSPETELGRALARDIAGFRAHSADVTQPAEIEEAVAMVEASQGPLAALIYNASGFQMGPIETIAPETFEAVWRATCFGAMAAARAALPRMAARGKGTALFTGATAALRGGANFAAFASAKFALRGLVQSLARAYWPKGVHVAHTIIDGMIGEGEGGMAPAEIAAAYLDLINQPRSAWTQELDLRPFGEKF